MPVIMERIFFSNTNTNINLNGIIPEFTRLTSIITGISTNHSFQSTVKYNIRYKSRIPRGAIIIRRDVKNLARKQEPDMTPRSITKNPLKRMSSYNYQTLRQCITGFPVKL